MASPFIENKLHKEFTSTDNNWGLGSVLRGFNRKSDYNQVVEYYKPPRGIFPRNEEVEYLISDKDVYLEGELVFKLNTVHLDLYTEIEKSKYILDLKDNWDDEGAISYEKETWKKAVVFVSKYISKIYDETSTKVPNPKIFHGPDGSIDLHWKNKKFNLLINVSNDSNLATFYGSSKDLQEIEGTFNLVDFNIHLLPSLIVL